MDVIVRCYKDEHEYQAYRTNKEITRELKNSFKASKRSKEFDILRIPILATTREDFAAWSWGVWEIYFCETDENITQRWVYRSGVGDVSTRSP